MAKGKMDAAAPDAYMQLVADIQAIQLVKLATSSAVTGNEWTSAVQQLKPLLSEAIQRTDKAVENDNYALLKGGLDSLKLWTNHVALLLANDLALSLEEQAKEAILSTEDQISLAKLVWSTCLSERTQISVRSKTLTEAIVLLLHRIYTSAASDFPQDKLLPYQKEAPFLSDLVGKSLINLERKQSPVILEIMLANYGSVPFLEAQPSSSLMNDSVVYERIIRGLGTLDGGATRRANLALGFLSARAQDLTCRLSLGAPGEEEVSLDETWRKWSSIWIKPLCLALQSGGERLRSGLANNHLAPLFELDGRVFPTLLSSLMECAEDATHVNIESIFLVLRTGKVQGQCRIGLVDDFCTEKAANGSNQVLIPASLLEDCILSATSELQISTLSLVIESKTPAAPLSTSEFGILRNFFPYGLVITNPSARGDLRGFFVKLLTRLRASTYALERDSGKITRIQEEERYPEERKKLAELQKALEESKSFLKWLYSLLRSTLHPGASYQASITALTFLDLMLESGIDPKFSHRQSGGISKSNVLAKNAGMSLSKSKQVFVQEFPFALEIISPSLVQLLLHCCESTYDDIQSRALTMLARFPAPLAGLEAEEVAAERILGRAAALMTGTRDFQCAAASRLVQLYQQIYMSQLRHVPASLLSLVGIDDVSGLTVKPEHPTLALVFNLFGFLSYQLSVAEAGNILEAANNHPVHGTLVTLQELFSPLRLVDLSSSDRKAYKKAVNEAQKLIDRTWQVTKAVLCNSAPEGNTGGSAEESATDGTAGLDQPSHETARAMRLVDVDNKAELMQTQEESNAGPKHQVILSYSWRGMKEASALLGILVASTLSMPSTSTSKKGKVSGTNGETAQLWCEIFDVELIQNIGLRFNLWLTQVRHRGAFSTIYPAYCNAVSAIVRSQALEIQTLPQQWTISFLDTVAQPGSQLSITRRSAGISYAVLALISAQTSRADTSMLQFAIRRLIDISMADSADPDSMPVASIHALNILRILVMDGSLSEFIAPFLGDLLGLTISKFKSRFWGLRNGSMMLFSSLCIRIFGSRNTNRDVKEARMPIEDFFATYSNVDVFFRRVLTAEAAQDADSAEGGESSLFAILMLFSRLQAPQESPNSETLKITFAQYRTLLQQCFSNKIWKIREIAAKAYAAFVPAFSAPGHVQIMLQQLQSSQKISSNTIHGTLLAAQRLIRGIADIEASPSTLQSEMALINTTLTNWAAQTGAFTCMITQTALLEVVQVHTALMLKFGHPLDSTAIVAWTAWSEAWLLSDVARLGNSLLLPGGLGLLGVCTRVLLQASHKAESSSQFISICERLLAASCSELRLSLLENLISEDTIIENLGFASADPGLLGHFLLSLHKIVGNTNEDLWHRIHAAELLHRLAAQRGTAGQSLLFCLDFGNPLEPWRGILETQQLAQLARTTICVPLREALLPYLADLCNLLLTSVDQAHESSVRNVIDDWARIVATCADENQSVQSREAAGQSMRALGHVLFPVQDNGHAALHQTSESVFKARVAAINLLTDDDEDVRNEAAAMIGETISLAAVQVKNAEELETKRAAIQRIARQGGASSDVSTERSWNWMARTYGRLARPGSTSRWTDFVWQELLPSEQILDQMFQEVFSANLLLFVEEKPNQFRDPESNIRRAAAFAQTQSASMDPDMRRSIFSRIADGLERLQTALEKNGPPTSSEAVHILATRLVLGMHAITESVPDSRMDETSTKAISTAKSVAQTMDISTPAFKTSNSLSDQSQESTNSTKMQESGSSQSRYNIA